MDKLKRLMPPGMELDSWRNYLAAAIWICVMIAVVGFVSGVVRALQALYDPITKELVEDARIWDFRYALGSSMDSFRLAMAIMAAFVGANYRYYFHESKSVYTMARISSPWEMHIRSWAVPLLGAGLLLAAKWLLTGILFVIYVLVTPEGVLKPGVDQLIRGLLL